jgi:isopentenyl-diphosphate Delta-isomerase
VTYETRRAGFERIDLPYRALPESDLGDVDTSVHLLGRRLRAPLLIGAMTGGADEARRINRNLAEAAQRLGVGMMLGSQRVMLERPARAPPSRCATWRPTSCWWATWGRRSCCAATACRGAPGGGGGRRRRARLPREPAAGGLQPGGDVRWRGVIARLAAVVPEVGVPVVLKEVGHGISGAVARAVAGVGFAAIDVAGAGGTSWARVEELLRHGEIRHPDLVEWGLPTVDALLEVAAALPGMPLIASGACAAGSTWPRPSPWARGRRRSRGRCWHPRSTPPPPSRTRSPPSSRSCGWSCTSSGRPTSGVGCGVLATSCRLTPMDLQIAGKTALVTGASKGIGFAVAAALAAEGVRLVVNGRDPGALAEAAERLRAGGAEVHPVAGDVAQAKALKALLAATREAIGDPAILISNAGGPPRARPRRSTTRPGRRASTSP